MRQDQDRYEAAAEAIHQAHALLITAGAGMGVDSGLPDFRGNQGFWRAYPAYADLGLSFVSLASPAWFQRDPRLAWGFYGHRLALYRRTHPHDGFAILCRWGAKRPLGAWVFTSNVDGQFQRAGFDPMRITECHGAIDFLQCTADCGAGLFPADPFKVEVDDKTFRARGDLPVCPRCGALARPNILMFGDFGWDESRTNEQETRMKTWLGSLAGRRVIVVECGAGTAIPTVRTMSEWVAQAFGGVLVRINVREPEGPAGTHSFAEGALAALRAIDAQYAVRERGDERT